MSCVVLVKSFMRHNVLVYALHALRKHYAGRIVVADDSYDFPAHVGAELVELDVELHRIGPNVGLSEGRNYLLRQVTEDRFLLMDNDFVLEDPLGLNKMHEVMSETGASIVGGLLWDKGAAVPRNFCGYFAQEDEVVVRFYRLPLLLDYTTGGTRYCECRICENFFLGDARKFQQHKVWWRKSLKTAEHEDFFIRLPMSMKVYQTPDVHVIHYPILEREGMIPGYEGFEGVKIDKEYSNYRHNSDWRAKVCELYGLRGEFFQYQYGVRYDWHQGFAPVRPITML